METTVERAAKVEEVRIDLRAGEQLIIATSRTHDGAGPSMQAYFEEIGPLAGSYGFTGRGQLTVVEANAGSFKPNNFVGLYTFPSAENAMRFAKDERWPAIKAKRPRIWSELRISNYVIAVPTTLRFQNSKVYEIRYEWLTSDAPMERDLTAGAGKLIASFTRGQHEMLPTELDGPARIQFIEWPDFATAKAHAPTADGYRRVDSLYTRVVIG